MASRIGNVRADWSSLRKVPSPESGVTTGTITRRVGGATVVERYWYSRPVLVTGPDGRGSRLEAAIGLAAEEPVLTAVVFTSIFARAAYRWMMRLDAQYGSGKGWTLESQMVKLPERAPRV